MVLSFMNPNSIRALALAGALLLPFSARPQVSLISLLPGVTNVVGQAAGNISNRMFSGDAVDLQAAYDKFMADMASQTQGRAADYRTLIDKHWSLTEQAILLRNAKLQGDKDAPIVDFNKAAKATVGGLVDSASGVGGSIAAGATSAISNSLLAGVKQGVLGGSKSTSSAFTPVEPTALDLDFVPSERVHPLLFFGKHPRDLNAKDLYRDNGYLGWRRLEYDDEAAAFAHITGQDPQALYAVFNYDAETGNMKSAFRVLKVSPAAFTSVVTTYRATMGDPRYASEPTVLRAIWENGAFVTADAERLSVGWAASVPYMFALTPPLLE